MHAMAAAQSDSSQALVLLCAGRTFIAGADITEFGKPPPAPLFEDVLERLETSKKPVVAAIHGMAPGGGFETALACEFRDALDEDNWQPAPSLERLAMAGKSFEKYHRVHP